MRRTGAVTALLSAAALLGGCAPFLAGNEGFGQRMGWSVGMWGGPGSGGPFAEIPIRDGRTQQRSVIVGFDSGREAYYGETSSGSGYRGLLHLGYRDYFGAIRPAKASAHSLFASAHSFFWEAAASYGSGPKWCYFDPFAPDPMRPWRNEYAPAGLHAFLRVGWRLRFGPIIADLSVGEVIGEGAAASGTFAWTFGRGWTGGNVAEEWRSWREEARGERARAAEERRELEEEARRAALEEAEARRGDAEEAEKKAVEEWRRREEEARKKRESVPALIEALKGGDRRERRRAAALLREKGAEAGAAVPALIEALGDARFDMRRSAADALAGIGPAAVPALVRALEDTESKVRWSAAYALGEIGPAAKEAAVQVTAALTRASEDEDGNVAACAAKALAKVRGRGR